MSETIGERLDREYPAQCAACDTPYKRMDGTWIDGMVRNICTKCGLDQTSSEAWHVTRMRQTWQRIMEGGKP